jgi:hypothetical protein
VNLAVSFGMSCLGLIALAMWVYQEKHNDFQPPSRKIPTAVYRLLEQARGRLFAGNESTRFTIFAPDPDSPDVLRAIARVGWGRPSAASQVRFKKGEGLAGKAWESGSNSIHMIRFDRFNTQEKARNAQAEILGLRPENVSALSGDQLKAEVLIAISLMDCGEWFKGVLCVDCRDWTNDLAEREFWQDLASVATEIAATLPATIAPQMKLETIQQSILLPKDTSAITTFQRVRLSPAPAAAA